MGDMILDEEEWEYFSEQERLAKVRLELIHDQADIIMDLREELKCTERKLRKALRGENADK